MKDFLSKLRNILVLISFSLGAFIEIACVSIMLIEGKFIDNPIGIGFTITTFFISSLVLIEND